MTSIVPELAARMVALIAVGGLTAALSTGSGLLVVISSAFVHDLYYLFLNPACSERKAVPAGGARRHRHRRVIAVLFGIFNCGINPQGIGVAGMLLNFAVTLALTPLFPPPS